MYYLDFYRFVALIQNEVNLAKIENNSEPNSIFVPNLWEPYFVGKLKKSS